MGTPCILIDDSTGQPGATSWLYENPLRIICANTLADVSPALAAVEDATAQGHYAAGYIAYEAGYALEPRLTPLCPKDFAGPFVWFGVFDTRTKLTAQQAEALWAGEEGQATNFALSHDLASYERDIAKILAWLKAGDAYQVNHTLRGSFTLDGTARGLYKALRPGQRVNTGAFIDTGESTILSLSPELFVISDGTSLESRPMKGTASRPPLKEADDNAAKALAADEKSRAENLMIVDLIRNDFSRIAKPGTVNVPSLFDVERHRTLLTMTSTVRAQKAASIGLADVMQAIFPCGSVTGAPKIRAMELIAELEDTPRGAYCGAIGHVAPGGAFSFNVPIRTLEIDNKGQGIIGLGSGIVADSNTKAEFEECWLKARFLTNPVPDFEIFETSKIEDGNIHLLDAHLERLAQSCAWFGRPFDGEAARQALQQAASAATAPTRLRFAVGFDGALSIKAEPLVATMTPAQGTIIFADETVQSDDPFVHHKTSHRTRYNKAMNEAVAQGHLDAIFENEWGEITEGARTNIFAEIDGTLITPPLNAGVLPGTQRAAILADPTHKTAEAPLTRADLKKASKLYICNSVMGWVPVTLVV